MRTGEDDHRALPLLPFQTFRLFASRTFPSSDAGPATLPLYLASLKVSETFSVRIVPRKVFSPSHLGPSIQLPSRMTVDITFSCDILIITRVFVPTCLRTPPVVFTKTSSPSTWSSTTGMSRFSAKVSPSDLKTDVNW